MSEKRVAIIAVVVVSVMVSILLIHGEIITDDNRFLITELAMLNQTILEQPLEYPLGTPQIETHFVEILPHAETGWHTHDVPLIVTVLHGEITVNYCLDDFDFTYKECVDTISNVYKTGDSFVEAINIEHNGINEGVIPVKIHVVTLNPQKTWDDVYLPEDQSLSKNEETPKE